MQIDRPIAIAVIIFAILLIVFFLLAPEYNTFELLQTNLGEKTAEFNAQHDYYAAIEKTYFDLQTHQDDLNKIDDALPSDSDLGRIIYFIQQTGSANGVIIENLSLSKITPSQTQSGSPSNIKNITFSLNLQGDYSSLENFMTALENSSRLFEINSISFYSSYQPANAAVSKTQNQFQTKQTYSTNLQITTHSY